MSAPPSDDKSKDKDKASRGSRSRSRHENRNNGPESANNKTNNEKTSEHRCTCTCHTEKQIQIVFEDDEAYEGTKFHPCKCDHCGPSVSGRQQCSNEVMEGFRFCGSCRGDQPVHEIFADMKKELLEQFWSWSVAASSEDRSSLNK
jgi:hypothetical protein